MEKRGLTLTFVSVFLSLMLVNIVSAQFYDRFSLSNILNSIDPSTMVLGTIFIISFALLNFSLSRFFRGNAGIAGIVAFSISLLIVWGINRTGFDYSSLFYNIFFFIPEDLLYTLVPFILLGLIIYGFVKLGLGETLAILGGFLLAIVIFTDLVYEKGLIIGIGTILFVIGIWLWNKKKSGVSGYSDYGRRGIGALGRGVDKYKQARDPRNRLVRFQEKQRIAEEQRLAKKRLKYKKGEEEEEIKKKLQSAYDHYKQIYQDTNNPEPARKDAGKMMRKILKQAANYGIKLNT